MLKLQKEPMTRHFPSFSEGLSLRVSLFEDGCAVLLDFPSFSEGLSLRARVPLAVTEDGGISLPFRRDFH